MNSRKAWPWAAAGCGGVTALTGMAFAARYVLEAVVKRRGEPDQSLLFWYLPILFMGAGGLVLGLAAALWGVRRLRQAEEEDDEIEGCVVPEPAREKREETP